MKTRRHGVHGFKRKKSTRSLRGGVHVTYEDGTYDGEVDKNGKKHGKGKMTYFNGEIYDGEWGNDKPNGMGKYVHPNGTTTYEGEFKDDEFSGYGEYKSAVQNRDGYKNFNIVYRGYFDKGKRNGFGHLYTSGRSGSGTIYGEFKNDKMIRGTGRRFNASGSGFIEEGDFINDQIRNGKRIWPDNEYMYEGEFDENGVMHGNGSTTNANGRKYVGEYQNGYRNGYGVMHYPNGDVYEGEFENDAPHGKGKKTYSDGKVYEGLFVKGEPHGPNAVTSSRRRIWEEIGMSAERARTSRNGLFGRRHGHFFG
jgi:hypothetical protein